MILLPYRFCGDKHHAFASPFVLIFLPLRLSCKESSTSNQAFLNSLYDPFGSPCRGQKPQEEGCNRPTRCSEPLRYKVGGASKPSPYCAGWDRLPIILLKVLDTTPILKPPCLIISHKESVTFLMYKDESSSHHRLTSYPYPRKTYHNDH